MLKGMLLGLTMIARIILAWALGLALIWCLAISGMGGVEPATWLTTLLAAASSPIILLALLICLLLPSVIHAKPLRFMVYALVLAMGVTAVFGGLLGAVWAFFAALPFMILFMLSLLILPLSRTRRWVA